MCNVFFLIIEFLALQREAVIYSRLKHENVVRFYGICLSSPACLVLEVCFLKLYKMFYYKSIVKFFSCATEEHYSDYVVISRIRFPFELSIGLYK